MNSRLVIYYIVKGFFPFFSWLICFKCVFSPLVITTFQLNPTAMPSCQGFFSFYVCASNYLLEKFGCNEKFANKHYNYKFHSKISSIHRFQKPPPPSCHKLHTSLPAHFQQTTTATITLHTDVVHDDNDDSICCAWCGRLVMVENP